MIKVLKSFDTVRKRMHENCALIKIIARNCNSFYMPKNIRNLFHNYKVKFSYE